MKRIVLTGGGTAEYVTPNIALIPSLNAVVGKYIILVQKRYRAQACPAE